MGAPLVTIRAWDILPVIMDVGATIKVRLTPTVTLDMRRMVTGDTLEQTIWDRNILPVTMSVEATTMENAKVGHTPPAIPVTISTMRRVVAGDPLEETIWDRNILLPLLVGGSTMMENIRVRLTPTVTLDMRSMVTGDTLEENISDWNILPVIMGVVTTLMENTMVDHTPLVTLDMGDSVTGESDGLGAPDGTQVWLVMLCMTCHIHSVISQASW